MNAPTQTGLTKTANVAVNTLSVKLDVATSLKLIKNLEGMKEVLVCIHPDQVDLPSYQRTRTETPYDIWIDGVETCHRLVLCEDGTWFMRSLIEI